MKKNNLIFVMLAFAIGVNAQTLDECQRAAEQNYPLIRQYDLIATTTDMTVKNIGKGWLPQIAASAQATYHSDVAAWPESMYGMFEKMGLDVKGLKKDQYRVGLDLQQIIFDGGAISSQENITREQGNVLSAQNEVNMYNVRKRVNDMYFALLLFDEQITLNDDVQELLMSSERQLTSMVKMGTAATSDLDNVKAERLNTMQQAIFVMWFFVVMMLLLSGLFTPTRSMPAWAYMTTYINPVSYFVEAVRNVFIRGGNIMNVWNQILALSGIGLFMGTWAVLSYKKNS